MLLTSLVATTMLIPVAATAQDEDLSAMRDQIAAMQAEIARLQTKVENLEQQRQSAERQPNGLVVVDALDPAPVAQAVPISPSTDLGFGAALSAETEEGWSFKPFGRLQFDAGTTALPDGLALADGYGSELRRIRLGVAGDMPGGFGYKLEVDFAGGDAEITDAILTYETGAAELTVGQHNNFQSLEELTSSRFSSFIERAAFTDAFGFERRLGLSVQYGVGDVLVQAGVFGDNFDDLPDSNSRSFDARAVYAPQIGGAQLHVGGSLHFTELNGDDSVRYRQRPLVHFTSNRLLDTGNVGADREFGTGLEAAAILGPLHFAGEAFWQSIDQSDTFTAADDPTFFGGYAEIGYFLTGERRGYKGGKFDRTQPLAPVGEGGIGAVQLVARYDRLDLSDAGITGGIQNGFYGSLIWVPTDYTRLMVNYGRLDYHDAPRPLPSGERDYAADVVGVRAQVDF
ncbi:porin [Aurantiacibacter spongiae]|nr:porin [Aurantiacibacter spongiae]